MLKAERVARADELTFFLNGEINEHADFQNLIGSPPAKICINTRRVTSVNSVGIGNYLKFIERLLQAGIKIRYAECSFAFTNCLQFVVGSHNRGCVESVVAPFSCKKCKGDFEVLVMTADVAGLKPQLTGQMCPDCKLPLQFDEIFAEYFSFLI